MQRNCRLHLLLGTFTVIALLGLGWNRFDDYVPSKWASALESVHARDTGTKDLADQVSQAGAADRTAVSPAEPAPYALEDANLVAKTISLIQNLYLNIEDANPRLMFEKGLEALAEEAPDVLWIPPQKDVSAALSVGRRVLLIDTTSVASINDLTPQFRRIFQFYVQARELKAESLEIEYGVIRGMLNTLDRPTRLLVDNGLDDFNIRSRGSLSGIGCRIGIRQEEPTVTEVMEASPSLAAGLQVGDKILRVDGESTINMTLSEVVSRIRGPVNSQVELEIRRMQFGDIGNDAPLSEEKKAGEIRNFVIQRQRITIENVESFRLSSDVGYLRITNFSDETVANFRTQLDRILEQQKSLSGLILDLRGNGGGSLRQSARMADEFVESGVIVKTQGRNDESVQGLIREITAEAGQVLAGVPMAVLVDRQSASGSEILAGALRYLNRAVLIGQQTFGKGSVQKVYPLHEHASIKMTVARYLVTGKHAIEGMGLTPDISLIPLVIDEGSFQFQYPTVQDDDEETDDKPTSDSQVRVPQASYSTVYYVKKIDKQALEKPRKERVEQDFEVQFAAQLLLASPRTEHDELLSQADAFLQTFGNSQSLGIESALQEVGIDWSKDPDAALGSPQGRLTFSGGDVLEPGKDLVGELTVVNSGPGPLQRLRVTTTSSDRLFNGLEFLFGRIEPQATGSFRVPLKIPVGATPGVRLVKLHYAMEGKPIAPPMEVEVAIRGLANPRLELEASYADEAPGTAGDHDRQVQLGEDVVLRLNLRNTGQAPSGQINVSLRNPAGRKIDLKTARVMLEPIDPNTQQSSELTFHVREAPTNLPLQLTLLAIDRSHRIHLEQTLDFGHPWSGHLAIVPPTLKIRSPIPTKGSAKAGMAIAGEASDSQGIRSITIYSAGHKVFHLLPGLQAERPATLVPFNAEIDLAVGDNRLDILAEDESGLITRYQLWALRTGS